MTGDLIYKSAKELLGLFERKEASPVEVIKAVLERVEERDRDINAFILVDEESALAQARDSEERWSNGSPKGLLDGVPISIKDMFLTKGWPTLKGSLTIDPKGPWEEDAPCVARLREHGAVIICDLTNIDTPKNQPQILYFPCFLLHLGIRMEGWRCSRSCIQYCIVVALMG